MNKLRKIRIVLADDHAVVREGLKSLLEAESDLVVVADAGDGRAAIEAARTLAPDVLVMDIGLPDLNGIDATRQLARDLPDVKVLCLSMHKEKRIIGAALRAGAAGYLVKSCASRELAEAIRTVARGKTYLSPDIAGDVLQELMQGADGDKKGVYAALSPREREVLQLIAAGRTTKEIAAGLHLSEKTVATHRLNVMEKLELYSVADLTRYAIREGLVEP
jgi:DNA-binding NarL/FixJ family response regulator